LVTLVPLHFRQQDHTCPLQSLAATYNSPRKLIYNRNRHHGMNVYLGQTQRSGYGSRSSTQLGLGQVLIFRVFENGHTIRSYNAITLTCPSRLKTATAVYLSIYLPIRYMHDDDDILHKIYDENLRLTVPSVTILANSNNSKV